MVCQNVTTGQAVTLNALTISWDCEAAGVARRRLNPQPHGGTTMHLGTTHPPRLRQRWGRLVMAALVGTVGLWQPSLAAEFTCAGGDVACLIRAMNEANANGEEHRIMLEAGTFTLTAIDHDTDGPTGLPAIMSGLTITGAGADTTVIERAAGAPPFRLLHVAATGVLTLEGLTLRGGIWQTSRAAASISVAP